MKEFLRLMGGLCPDCGRSAIRPGLIDNQISSTGKKYRRIRFLNKVGKDRLEQIREFLERSIILN